MGRNCKGFFTLHWPRLGWDYFFAFCHGILCCGNLLGMPDPSNSIQFYYKSNAWGILHRFSSVQFWPKPCQLQTGFRSLTNVTKAHIFLTNILVYRFQLMLFSLSSMMSLPQAEGLITKTGEARNQTHNFFTTQATPQFH